MLFPKIISLFSILHISSGLVIEEHRTTTLLLQPQVKRIPQTVGKSVTAVTSCHMHAAIQYCMAGATEYQLVTTATATGPLPAQYTGCHSHAGELWCFAPDGAEIQFILEGAHTSSTSSTGGLATATSPSVIPTGSSGGQNCHFHAGVEHCVGEGENEHGESTAVSANGTVVASSLNSCARRDRDYNIPLRIGLLFVILTTSLLGVITPILITSFTRLGTENLIFVVLKQFGTGVIISTAFIHLFTHAFLMFSNSCLGTLNYEGTTAAIFMAGLFLSFLVEYLGQRLLHWKKVHHGQMETAPSSHTASGIPNNSKVKSGSRGSDNEDSQMRAVRETPLIATPPNTSEMLSVLVLEVGIIFHSILIGLTLVVAGDSFFITLFVVILFHQTFEGIALGTQIAALPSTPSATPRTITFPVSLPKKIIMAVSFAITTPLGMGIGIGVLKHFNGNDPSTIVVIGTLDALSAGVLAWVGVVEMWARDWVFGGSLVNANMVKATIAGLALVSGLVIMSILGKWA
ncbi:ZIP zinc transporter-domain-containing protein [Tricladium varicosporioides]|nr:ZIP zinc transporter-domain-containing protein [Hymenoscyphus varicosporioides]